MADNRQYWFLINDVCLGDPCGDDGGWMCGWKSTVAIHHSCVACHMDHRRP